MIDSKVKRLFQRIASADIAWLVLRVQLAMRIRGVVPRPELLVSYISSNCPPQRRPLQPKLLVFSHNLDYEGASISLKELVCGLKLRNSIEPEVVSFEEGPLRIEYESHNIPITVLPSLLHRISTPKRLSREVDKLALYIKKSGCDAVFVNTLLNFAAILAAEKAGIPSIWNPRESEPWNSYFRFLPDSVAMTAVAAIGLPRKVIFVAEATRHVWRDFESVGNFQVIKNSLNTDRFLKHLNSDKITERYALGWGKNEVVFLCVATLCDRKGQMDALLALERVAGKIQSRVRLVFVGDSSSPYAQACKRMAAQFNEPLKVNIDFVDVTTSIGRYYAASDVFLLCSRIESYPRVILEAMAFGLPIVSTPVFGIAEQLPDSEDACLYEPGDINALCKIMLHLINSPATRQHFGERITIRYSQLKSFDQMLTEYLRIFSIAISPQTESESPVINNG